MLPIKWLEITGSGIDDLPIASRLFLIVFIRLFKTEIEGQKV